LCEFDEAFVTTQDDARALAINQRLKSVKAGRITHVHAGILKFEGAEWGAEKRKAKPPVKDGLALMSYALHSECAKLRAHQHS